MAATLGEQIPIGCIYITLVLSAGNAIKTNGISFMGKGTYLGGGTVIGPKTPDWFGRDEDDAFGAGSVDNEKKSQLKPLTPAIQHRIDKLKIDIAGLQCEFNRIQISIVSSQEQLRNILNECGISDKEYYKYLTKA